MISNFILSILAINVLYLKKEIFHSFTFKISHLKQLLYLNLFKTGINKKKAEPLVIPKPTSKLIFSENLSYFYTKKKIDWINVTMNELNTF